MSLGYCELCDSDDETLLYRYSGENWNNNGKSQPGDYLLLDGIFSITRTDAQMQELLPYCNALDFEPYRDREMSSSDPGCIGYRDEIQVYFTGITDSHIPKIKLPMTYYYDEEHIWPSEKLYRYLIETYLKPNKKLRKWTHTYGGFSLFF